MEGVLERLYQRVGRHHLRLFCAVMMAVGLLSCPLAVATFTVYEPITTQDFWVMTGVAMACCIVGVGLVIEHTLRLLRPAQAWLDAGLPAEGAARAWQVIATAPAVGARGSFARAALGAALPVSVVAALYFDLPVESAAVLFGAVVAGGLLPTVLFFLGWELYVRPLTRRAALLANHELSIDRSLPSLYMRLLVIVPSITAASAVLVSVVSTGGQDDLGDLGVDVLTAVGITGSVSFLLVFLLARSVVDRVAELLAATQAIAHGDLERRVPPMVQDEIGMLTSSFNAMTAELQRSRERLVSATEQERRRLRRELHDGLGPTLASLALQADLAARMTATDPDGARGVLERLASNARQAAKEARRIAHDLRPPALDDLGLLDAVRDCATQLSLPAGDGITGGLHIDVAVPQGLPALPAEVEVAAFRIVQEALTNVVRHSDADRCTVRLALNGALELEISDDGRGLQDGPAGLGLASMRERAAGLGGTCTVGPGDRCGTVVRARLPVPASATAT